MAIAATPLRSGYVTAVLIGFGGYSVALGLFMLLAPATFSATLGAFGDFNRHYVFDNATFELPLGLLLLTALRLPAWAVPGLAFAVVHWAMHAINHAVDHHHAAGSGAGWAEAAGLLAGTVLLASALAYVVRQGATSVDRGLT